MKQRLLNAWSVLKLPLIAVLVGFIVGAICILAAGSNPITAYVALFKGSLASIPSIGETLYKVTPILLTGLAAAIGFRCGLFNIGGEGQYVVGLTVAQIFALLGPQIPVMHWMLALALAMVAGAFGAASSAGSRRSSRYRKSSRPSCSTT